MTKLFTFSFTIVLVLTSCKTDKKEKVGNMEENDLILKQHLLALTPLGKDRMVKQKKFILFSRILSQDHWNSERQQQN